MTKSSRGAVRRVGNMSADFSDLACLLLANHGFVAARPWLDIPSSGSD